MLIAFRAIAVSIAVAAVIDVSIPGMAATRPRLALVVQNPQSPDAERVRMTIARDLGSDYDCVPHVVSDAAAAIVIGDRYPAEPVPDILPVSTVTMPVPTDQVRIVGVSAPAEVPPATTIRIVANLAAHGVAGRTTELRARVAGVEAASASHRWGERDERWQAPLDVVPVGEPPFIVRIEAVTPGSNASSTSAADLVVLRRDAPLAVEFFDARLSWASTFVRRALESDPRFHLESVSMDARALSTKTPRAVPLDDRRLDAFSVVVVGGLDHLSGDAVSGLERYMRERGGAVVLLPDQRIDNGPLRRLLPPLSERLVEQPAVLVSPGLDASLRASELLVAGGLHPGSDVLARAPGDDRAPVIVSRPFGDGRVLVSGAMDAWRYRAVADAAFDRFWQATIAGLALAAPPALDVMVAPPIVRPLESAEMVVRVRGSADARVSAAVNGQPIRLAPDAERGVYRGGIVGSAARRHTTIDVRAVGGDGRVESLVRTVPTLSNARPFVRTEPSLSMLAASHRGVDATPDRVAEVERFIRASAPPSRAATMRHPMRSAWWIAPFVACLSTEWWIRRRRGLR